MSGYELEVVYAIEESNLDGLFQIFSQIPHDDCRLFCHKADDILNPLQFAILANNLHLIQSLLENTDSKIDVNAPSFIQNKTALHYVAETGNCEMVHILLRFGADVDRIDRDSMTPLMIAIKNDNAGVVSILASLSDLTAKNNVGDTPLILSIRLKGHGHSKSLDIMIDEAKNTFEIADSYGNFPFQIAQDYNICPSQFQKLIEIPSFNVNIQDYKGETMLHKACLARDYEFVEFLISQHADPFITDKVGRKPSDVVGKYGTLIKNMLMRYECVEKIILIKSGALDKKSIFSYLPSELVDIIGNAMIENVEYFDDQITMQGGFRQAPGAPPRRKRTVNAEARNAEGESNNESLDLLPHFQIFGTPQKLQIRRPAVPEYNSLERVGLFDQNADDDSSISRFRIDWSPSKRVDLVENTTSEMEDFSNCFGSFGRRHLMEDTEEDSSEETDSSSSQSSLDLQSNNVGNIQSIATRSIPDATGHRLSMESLTEIDGQFVDERAISNDNESDSS